MKLDADNDSLEGHALALDKAFVRLCSDLVNVRMYETNVIVTGNAVAQRAESLINALHHDFVRQAVPYVRQLCARVHNQLI